MLTIRAVSFKGRPLDRELVARFEEAGGTIGRGESNTLVLEIQSGDPTASPLQDVSFFPYDPGLIENASPQKATAQPGPSGTVYQLRIERARMPAGNLTRVYGLLVANGLSRVDGPAAIEVNVPVSRR